jgi:MoaA/NifB/PqqE/SkfB family radical SAM enzyme
VANQAAFPASRRRPRRADAHHQRQQLTRYAAELAESGIKRIKVSLDTLDPDKFRAITRWGDHAQVMGGIDTADRAGLKIKIKSEVPGFAPEYWQLAPTTSARGT